MLVTRGLGTKQTAPALLTTAGLGRTGEGGTAPTEEPKATWIVRARRRRKSR